MNAAFVSLALFYLGGAELVLIFALVLILFGAGRLPPIGRGFRRGMREFRKATREVAGEADQAAHDAGQSVGGIYGKLAAEALTQDNQTAELYDPAVFQKRSEESGGTNSGRRSLWRWLWGRLCSLFSPRRHPPSLSRPHLP